MAHLPFQGDNSANGLLPAVALGTGCYGHPGATQSNGSGDASSEEECGTRCRSSLNRCPYIIERNPYQARRSQLTTFAVKP